MFEQTNCAAGLFCSFAIFDSPRHLAIVLGPLQTNGAAHLVSHQRHHQHLPHWLRIAGSVCRALPLLNHAGASVGLCQRGRRWSATVLAGWSPYHPLPHCLQNIEEYPVKVARGEDPKGFRVLRFASALTSLTVESRGKFLLASNSPSFFPTTAGKLQRDLIDCTDSARAEVRMRDVFMLFHAIHGLKPKSQSETECVRSKVSELGLALKHFQLR